jgi:hypothetical protein
MPKLESLTLEQFELIRDHNQLVFDAAVKALVRFRSVPVASRNDWIKGNISYWVNVKQTCRWSTQIARQRCPEAANAAGSTV